MCRARTTTAALALAVLVAVPAGAAGQESWPVGLEVTVGTGVGVTTAETTENGRGLAGDVLLAARALGVGGGGAVVAAGLGVQGAGDRTLECRLASGGGCIHGLPTFTVASLLAGFETAGAGRRVLFGPSAVRVEDGSWAIHLGWLARADAAAPLAGPLSLVASLRGFVVPSHRGDLYGLASLAFGLRLR